MENKRELLKETVDSIKKAKLARGIPISNEEIARKLDISEKQMSAYLNGEEDIPAGLIARLKSAYRIESVMVWSVKEMEVPDPEPPKDEAEEMENRRKSLQSIIRFITGMAKDVGISITEEDMAEKIGISPKQLRAYLNGEENRPEDLTQLLLSAYEDLLHSVQTEKNRDSLRITVVKIRNLGLAKGMDITVREMAVNIGLSLEQLYGYLNAGYDIQENVGFRLSSAYKDLIGEVNRVRVMEDIDVIMENVFLLLQN